MPDIDHTDERLDEVRADLEAWERARQTDMLVAAARALRGGCDVSRGQPGDGRCRKHRIRGCRCEGAGVHSA